MTRAWHTKSTDPGQKIRKTTFSLIIIVFLFLSFSLSFPLAAFVPAFQYNCMIQDMQLKLAGTKDKDKREWKMLDG